VWQSETLSLSGWEHSGLEKKYQQEKAYDERHDDDDDDDDDYNDNNTIYGTKRTYRQNRCYVGDGLSENYTVCCYIF
jgi:hypothetical protein